MDESMGNQFTMIFDSSRSKREKRALATETLRVILEKPENRPLAELWAHSLMKFGDHELAEAFQIAALTCSAWPTLAEITGPIIDAEYVADLAWILTGLRRHKADWQDRPAVRGESLRVRNDAESRFDWVLGPVIEEAIPAPTIPPRLRYALEIVGGVGTVAPGLAELSRHPAVGMYTWDTVESGKVRYQCEKEFKSAWMIARRRDLAR